MAKLESGKFEGADRRRFTRCLLRDLRALEQLLAEGMLEEGVRRIGAEQEMFLVDRGWRPAPRVLQMLDKLDDPHFTTELGRFNLEANLDPQPYGGKCLSKMETHLEELVDKARRAADELESEVVLTGILPTIRKSDLGLDNMTPDTRYFAINEAMSQIRGGAYDFDIKGLDELRVKHDSVMVEACNASFQVHFQSGAREFANLYNIAMATAGPVLAAASNSPMLMGRRLWCETRIAVFQQSVDTRSTEHQRHSIPRVTFGDRWVQESVLEIYREDIARFRTLLGTPVEEDPLQNLADGIAPELRALRLHNGTVYRWIRPCYGIIDGVPHLRIENRVLPSGPSIRDEIANGAFWFGLMGALAEKYEDLSQVMEFESAQMNFFAAAHQGLAARLTWIDGEELSAQELILDRLLPLAAEGMNLRNIDEADRDLYLGVIEQRVSTGRTGSRWLLHSLAGMRDEGTPGERLNALVAGTVSRQKTNRPVAEWDLTRIAEGGGWRVNFDRVEQYMTTDLFTVQADESVELVANIMEWGRVRHVMVEDHDHQLIGLVSYRAVLRLLARGESHELVSVSEIMKTELLTATPETPTLQAISVMRENRIACLPVVSEGKLVGVITENDFMGMADDLLRLGGHATESGNRAT